MTTDVDLLVIGGGIAGAGVALEAARRGVSVMLVEARDFAWGSSSRSSKLVHGGLRYLREGAFGLTRESVRERGRLLHDAPGLVEPQRFLIGHYQGRSPSRREMAVGLAIYDAMAGERTRAFHSPAQVRELAPHVATDGLIGASAYLDAEDRRRAPGDARAAGGAAARRARGQRRGGEVAAARRRRRHAAVGAVPRRRPRREARHGGGRAHRGRGLHRPRAGPLRGQRHRLLGRRPAPRPGRRDAAARCAAATWCSRCGSCRWASR